MINWIKIYLWLIKAYCSVVSATFSYFSLLKNNKVIV